MLVHGLKTGIGLHKVLDHIQGVVPGCCHMEWCWNIAVGKRVQILPMSFVDLEHLEAPMLGSKVKRGKPLLVCWGFVLHIFKDDFTYGQLTLVFANEVKWCDTFIVRRIDIVCKIHYNLVSISACTLCCTMQRSSAMNVGWVLVLHIVFLFISASIETKYPYNEFFTALYIFHV